MHVVYHSVQNDNFNKKTDRRKSLIKSNYDEIKTKVTITSLKDVNEKDLQKTERYLQHQNEASS